MVQLSQIQHILQVYLQKPRYRLRLIVDSHVTSMEVENVSTPRANVTGVPPDRDRRCRLRTARSSRPSTNSTTASLVLG